HPQGDRLLGVEVALHLGAGLEQFIGDAGRQRRLRNVDDQVGHLVLAGQLPQHLLQHHFHLGQLLLERLEVGRPPLLALELGAQGLLGALFLGEDLALLGDEVPPGEGDDQQDQEQARAHLDLGGPGARVVEVEVAEIDLLAHWAPPAAGTEAVAGAAPASAPSSSAFGVCSRTLSENMFGRPRSSPMVAMIVRSGVDVETDSSRLRMKELTRALVWACPYTVCCWPACLIEYRRTPSGIVQTSLQNKCTICERLTRMSPITCLRFST